MFRYFAFIIGLFFGDDSNVIISKNLRTYVVDCKWGVWSLWSTCSRSCGKGSQQRSRRIVQNPSNGGKECQGGNSEKRDCNTQQCKDSCQNLLRYGNGTGPGNLTSPNFPSNYGNSATCTWHLSTTEGYIINVEFNSFMVNTYFMYHNFKLINPLCPKKLERNYDFLTIHDGNSRESPELARLSGTNLDNTVIYKSSKNDMFILFTSDGSVTAKGFSAEIRGKIGILFQLNKINFFRQFRNTILL